MPYGDFKNNRFFMEGVELSKKTDFSSVEELASYVETRYGKDNAYLVILGYAAERKRNGMILEGKVILHEMEMLHMVRENEKLREMLERACEHGERRMKEYAEKFSETKRRGDDDHFDVDAFLEEIGIKT